MMLRRLWGRRNPAKAPSRDVYHFIVVGGGTAGALIASRLAAKTAPPTSSSRSGPRVLLLEAGGSDAWRPSIIVPAGYLVCIGNPRTDWMLMTESEPGLNGRALRYPRGKVLGGCSSINGMISMRGQRGDYDGWAAATGDDSWKWERCVPYFKKHERHWRGSDDPSSAHGSAGEYFVQQQQYRQWACLERFIAAAEEYGIPRVEDFNPLCGDNSGVGYFEVNQKSGTRWNTSKAFLHAAFGNPADDALSRNIDIVVGAQVPKLIMDGSRCVGVVVRLADGSIKSIRLCPEQTAEHDSRPAVILSCGAVNTPHVLMHSGIGDEQALKKAGIDVRHVLRGVGRNLQDHLQLRTVFRLSGAPTLNTMVRSVSGCVKIGLDYALRRSGPLSMAPSQVGCFWASRTLQELRKTSTASLGPDIQFHVQPLSLPAFGEPLHPFDAMTVSVCNLRPTSRGFIRPSPADRPFDAPTIQPCYLSTEHDRRAAVDAIKLARSIMGQPAMSGLRPEEFLPGAAVSTDSDLVRAAGNIGTTIFHPVATCKMGAESDSDAVVDSRLNVRGVEGLMIADASVMPTITSGNTNTPTLMIAERAAELALNSRTPP